MMYHIFCFLIHCINVIYYKTNSLFSLSILYLVGGVAYQKFKNHATGIDLIPNVHFWIALPGLVKVFFFIYFSNLHIKHYNTFFFFFFCNCFIFNYRMVIFTSIVNAEVSVVVKDMKLSKKNKVKKKSKKKKNNNFNRPSK